jgi:hypothetical protein
MTKVVAIMSMSLDGYVADATDGVAEVFDWYFSGDVEIPMRSATSDMTFRVSPPSGAPSRKEKTPFAGLLESPLTDSNRRPPPYHGSLDASRAYTCDHTRRGLSCKSGRSEGWGCVARRRAEEAGERVAITSSNSHESRAGGSGKTNDLSQSNVCTQR